MGTAIIVTHDNVRSLMSTRPVRLPTEEDFAAARDVISRHLEPTPLVSTPLGKACWLKMETFQPTGSFKVRGALAAMSAAPLDRNLITASAGNHALGVAHAASVLGHSAMVVVAESASQAKIEALRKLPVQLVTHGESYDEAEAWAISRADAPAGDVDYLSPYNDPNVIAGQATMLDEILDQHQSDRPLTIVAPVGGGGLLSGLGLRASQLSTDVRPIRIIGVEAEASPGMSAAIEAGEVTTVEIEGTIADGLAGNLEPGSITVELVRRHVADLVSVTDDETGEAIRWLVKTHGFVAEAAGSASIAAVQAGVVPEEYLDDEVVIIVSGRNITLETLSDVLRGDAG